MLYRFSFTYILHSVSGPSKFANMLHDDVEITEKQNDNKQVVKKVIEFFVFTSSPLVAYYAHKQIEFSFRSLTILK